MRVEPVPSLTAAAARACAQVGSALPKDLAAGVSRRPTTPDSPTTAAWGVPAITLRCGTDPGSALDEPFEFDGVRWAMHDSGASRTWTTIGTRVAVQVVVPDHYDGQAEMLGALASAVRAPG